MTPSLASATWLTCSSMTIHGKFHRTVKTKNGKLVINGKVINVWEREPQNKKWGDGGAKYFVQFTGVFNTTEKAVACLKGTDKRVTLSAPSIEAYMFVLGMKHQEYNSLRTVSDAALSCTNQPGQSPKATSALSGAHGHLTLWMATQLAPLDEFTEAITFGNSPNSIPIQCFLF